MPTREKLESALRNAHAAGDIAAAKQIANAIKSSNIQAPKRTAEQTEALRVQRLDDLPEIGLGSGLVADEGVSGKAVLAATLPVTTDPQEIAKILTKQFPNVGISQSPEGRLVAVNNDTGAAAEINKPGLSSLDVAQALGLAATFIPSGAGLAGTAVKTLGTLAARTAATQAGIEAAQAGAGGDFDPENVAIAGATAPVGQVVGDKVLSPVVRAAGGKISSSMKELFKSAKEQGVDVLTTDVLPPKTFGTKTLQQLGEKLGVLGTGGKRAAQQRARIEIVEDLAQELGVTLDAPIEKDIFSSLKRGVASQLNKAAMMRREAVETLDQFGPVSVNDTVDAITEQISRQKRLKLDADQAIIKRLENLRVSVQNGNFSLIKDLRSNLIDDISAAFKGEVLPTKAAAPLQAVKSAMDGDLLNFAKASDRSAGAKWLQSNKIFADGYRKAKDTEIKRLLKKGEGTPEIIANILKGGKTSELKRLSSLVGDDGRKSAQLSIIRDALTESGFFTTGANPDRFATAISKPARQKAVNVFFKGSDAKQIEGIKRVLQATRRAQEAPVSTATGQQLAAPVAAIAGAQLDAGVSFGVAGGLAAMSRAYESAGMRNLLLRMAAAPKGSQAEQRVLQQIMPFFNGAVQAAREKGN